MKLTGLTCGGLPRMATALLSFSSLALLCGLHTSARADGPGLPNLTYSSSEVFKSIYTFKSDVNGSARGHGTVQMVNGYLFVPFGVDSGHPGGGFSFWAKWVNSVGHK